MAVKFFPQVYAPTGRNVDTPGRLSIRDMGITMAAGVIRETTQEA